MPGYADTKKLIEDTLVNRPAGTVIIPEDHQTFALSMLDYIHSVELLGASSLQGAATVDTVPVQPTGSRVSYISSVPPGQTYVYTNFLDENGDPITVTSGANTLSLLTLLWNGTYWTVSTTPVTLAVGYTNGYLFKGIAVPTDNPGTPDQNVFYIASQTGTYTNFGGLAVADGEVAILRYNGSWAKEITGAATAEKVTRLEAKVDDLFGADIFTESGFYSSSNGNFYAHSSWKCTKKLKLRGTDITGYFYLPSSQKNGAAVFFDSNGDYISAYFVTGGTIGANTIPASAFPNNAVYIGIITLASYLDSSYLNFGVTNSLLLKDVMSGQITEVNSQLSAINGRVNDTNSVIGKPGAELFLIDGYYDAHAGNFVLTDQVKTTPLLKIYGDIWANTYMGGPTYNYLGIAFFNANKEFISGTSGTTAGLQFTHIAKADIPAGAVYFAISTLVSFIESASLSCGWNGASFDLSGKTDELKNGVDLIENEVEELQGKMEYSDAVSGLVFDSSEEHQLAKRAIKAVWLTYGGLVTDSIKPSVDALRASLANTKLYITYLYNVNGTYGCFLRVDDAPVNGNNCFSKYVQGIHTITGDDESWDLSAKTGTVVWPYDSGISVYPFKLWFAIDWNELNNKTVTSPSSAHPIEINFGELNWGERVETKDIREVLDEVVQGTSALNSINLNGKTIVCIGDSLTEMVDATNSKHYSDYIAERTGATCINIGFGGTMLRQRREMAEDFDLLPESTEAEIAEKSRYAYATIDIINLIKAIVANDFTEQTKAVNWLANHSDDNRGILSRVKAIDWSSVDGVTIFAGTNDWGSNNPILGTSGSTDVNYTLGAINEIVRLLMSTFKHLKIYTFTPIVRWMDYSGGTGTDAEWSDVRQYGDGTLRYFSEQVQKEWLLNHLPCCDMYNTLGWNKNNFSEYFPESDGTHPRTLKGVTFLAKKMGAFILANNTL